MRMNGATLNYIIGIVVALTAVSTAIWRWNAHHRTETRERIVQQQHFMEAVNANTEATSALSAKFASFTEAYTEERFAMHRRIDKLEWRTGINGPPGSPASGGKP